MNNVAMWPWQCLSGNGNEWQCLEQAGVDMGSRATNIQSQKERLMKMAKTAGLFEVIVKVDKNEEQIS